MISLVPRPHFLSCEGNERASGARGAVARRGSGTRLVRDIAIASTNGLGTCSYPTNARREEDASGRGWGSPSWEVHVDVSREGENQVDYVL